MAETRKPGQSPSERGRNYTPLGEVVHCALPGASCGQQMISVDFQSAPIITGDATLPLRWLRQLPLCRLAARNYLALQTISVRQVFRNSAILFQWDSI